MKIALNVHGELKVGNIYAPTEGEGWYIGRGEKDGKRSNLANPFALYEEANQIPGMPPNVLENLKHNSKLVSKEEVKGAAKALYEYLAQNEKRRALLSGQQLEELVKLASGERRNKQLFKDVLDHYARSVSLEKYRQHLERYISMAKEHNKAVAEAEKCGKKIMLPLAKLEDLRICRNICREMLRIAECVKNGKKISLLCFCHPKPCHGDIIVEKILAHLEGSETIELPNSTSTAIVRQRQ